MSDPCPHGRGSARCWICEHEPTPSADAVDWRARALALATELSEARQTLDDAAKSYVRSMQDSDARETATRGRAERLERAGQALATAVRNLIEARLYEDPDVLVCRKERDDALDAWSAAVAGAGEEKR